MLKLRLDEEHEAAASGGTRALFTLGHFRFHDTLDDDGAFHHWVVEDPAGEDATHPYELDRDTMYEFMARYLAGAYELEEYDLDQSPAHLELLDVLEIATARARAGESEFSWEAFDQADSELMDDEGDAPSA